MTTCSLWMVGGSSYSAADAPTVFRSVAAKEHADEFWTNWNGDTPCAGDVVFHFFRCASEAIRRRDPYPDEVWSRSARGGVRRDLA